jgi:hypothetical protein
MLGLLVLVVGGSIASAAIWGFNYLVQHPSSWGDLVLLLILCILFVLIIKAFSSTVYVANQDWLRWRKWFKNHQGTMTYQEFCETISFHSSIRTQLALRRARVLRKLAATAETELFLKTLAFEVEVRQRVVKANQRAKFGKATKAILPVSLSDETENEYIRGCTKHLWVHGPAVLDDIYMLLEDVHQARQNASNKVSNV